jgi:hypothetical protein
VAGVLGEPVAWSIGGLRGLWLPMASTGLRLLEARGESVIEDAGTAGCFCFLGGMLVRVSLHLKKKVTF